MKPDGARFEHDGCENCCFHGQLGKSDVWHCPNNGGTIMLRDSDEPSDYRSMPATLSPSVMQDARLAYRVAQLIVEGEI
jgi:hypothetical protein